MCLVVTSRESTKYKFSNVIVSHLNAILCLCAFKTRTIITFKRRPKVSSWVKRKWFLVLDAWGTLNGGRRVGITI